jgi:zinc protease
VRRRDWLAMAAAGAWAAEPKNRAPVSRETLMVKMPEAEPVRLSNGVTLLTMEDRRLPVVTVMFRIEGAGEIYSTRRGVAELTADMLQEGTAGRSGKQLVEAASRLGATLWSAVELGAEVAVVNGEGLASRWAEWFELLCGVVRQPTFPADDFQNLRQRWIAGLRMRRPGALADQRLQQLVYGKHPAAVTIPTAAELASLTPEMLAAWHRERYAPSNTVIGCVGRVRSSDFRDRVEKLLGSWSGPNVQPALPPPPEPLTARRIILIDRPEARQTEIAIGGLLFDRRDADLFPFILLNGVLGNGFGSRFQRILRREKGYAFSAYSNYSAGRYPGMWRGRASVRGDATTESLDIMLTQLRQLCDQPLAAEELERAKRAAVGGFALTLESPSQVLTNSYLRFRYGFSADYWERYPAKINAVTPGEVQAVAQKYCNPERVQIVLAGDAAHFRGAIEKLGKVES